MKPLIVLATALLVIPFTGTAAMAACSSSDFDVQNFELSVDNCRGRNCPRLIIKGELINNCGSAAAARVEVEAMTGGGRVVDSVDGWPARTSNLDPGERIAFDFTGMMSFERNMEDFSVSIVEVREW